MSATVDSTWRKSRHSNEAGGCVELHHTLTRIRDSKHPTAVLATGRTAVAHLVGWLAVDEHQPTTSTV